MTQNELKAIVDEAVRECEGHFSDFDCDMFLANLVRQQVIKEILDILRAMISNDDAYNIRGRTAESAIRQIQERFSLHGL